MEQRNEFSLAEDLYKHGKYKKSAALYRKILNREPENAEAHQNLARCLLRLKKYQEAETEADKALEINSRLPESYAVLGYLHILRKDFEQAWSFYRKANELDSKEVRYYLNLSYILTRQGNFEEGLKILLQAESMNPREPLVHQNLSYIYAKQKSKDLALKEAWKSFRLHPTVNKVTWLISRLMAKRPLIGAITVLIVTLLLLAMPVTSYYSKVAIILSTFALIVVVVFAVDGIILMIRSDRNRKYSIAAIQIIILLLYLLTVYFHWNHPVLTKDNFQINISTFEIQSESQSMAGLVPDRSLGINISITNHLKAKINCELADQRRNNPFSIYTGWAEFQAWPGKTNKEVVINYTSGETEAVVRCENDLSIVTSSISLPPPN